MPEAVPAPAVVAADALVEVAVAELLIAELLIFLFLLLLLLWLFPLLLPVADGFAQLVAVDWRAEAGGGVRMSVTSAVKHPLQ